MGSGASSGLGEALSASSGVWLRDVALLLLTGSPQSPRCITCLPPGPPSVPFTLGSEVNRRHPCIHAFRTTGKKKTFSPSPCHYPKVTV